MVVPELVKRGASVRSSFIVPKMPTRPNRQATEVVVGDLCDEKSMASALNGVDGLFYLAPVFQHDEAEIGKGVVRAAKKAGVRRVVFSSVIHPTLAALENHISKGPVEEAIIESNLEYVLLEPAMFFQNYEPAWALVCKTGILVEPYSAETQDDASGLP